jgi:BirA family biotin operon repressor/biotin-[acetyl-CoA-carboxylase] ligase
MDFKITRLKETDSTNKYLKNMAYGGAPFGTVVIAERQEAGHGRMGRAFSSERGGLYMSILLPLTSPEATGLLTTYAAVAVARALESLTPLDVKIKWVNDLYVGGKKLCGILAEGGATIESGERFAVLGIGVNLDNELPNELLPIATTVKKACGQTVSPIALAERILREFECADRCDYGAHINEYRHRCMILGKNIDIFPHQGEKYEAVALDILHDGSLLVKRLSDGENLTLFGGEVSLRGWEE